MAYDEIIKQRTCSAPQCRIGIDQEIRFSCKSSRVFGLPLRNLHTPSLSLCPQSKDYRERSSNSGSKDCFYSQAITEPDPQDSETCEIYWSDYKRNSYAGSGRFSSRGSEEWLKGRNRSRRSSWNTAPTDCTPTKLFKCIDFWYPTENGKLVRKTNA